MLAPSVVTGFPVPRVPWLEQAPAARFTVNGSDELEWHLSRGCERIAAGVERIIPRRRLEALMLGGGYGQGEGGVLKSAAGDRLAYDLEFHVCVAGSRFWNQQRYQAALHTLAETLSPTVEVGLRFEMTSLAQLRHSSVSMRSYELVMAHRWLGGHRRILSGCEHHCLARRIPMADATRLLMNSCSDLLFARLQLDEERLTAAAGEEVARALARAQLAFGDVVLTAFGHYHWSCRERLRRLLLLDVPEELSWLQTLRRHHAQGVEFKLRPQCEAHPRVALRSLHDELSVLGLEIWLWLESRRLACLFTSARDYALSPVNKCPETAGCRNLLLNASTHARGALVPSRWHRHPRQRLLHALALLLWEPVLWADGESLHRVREELGTTARTFSDLLSAYRSLWRRFR